MPEMLTEMIISTIDRTDTERENVMKLVVTLKSENLITSTQFIDVSIRIKSIACCCSNCSIKLDDLFFLESYYFYDFIIVSMLHTLISLTDVTFSDLSTIRSPNVGGYLLLRCNSKEKKTKYLQNF